MYADESGCQRFASVVINEYMIISLIQSGGDT